VIGAGKSAWQTVETCLAQVGGRLGSGVRDYAAAGVSSLFFRLMFGEAMAYQGIEIDNLARIAGPSLLDLLSLGGDGSATDSITTVHRFLPDLSPAPSLRLLEHGVSFGSTARSAS
jgi:hypothetical protein